MNKKVVRNHNTSSSVTNLKLLIPIFLVFFYETLFLLSPILIIFIKILATILIHK